MNMLAYTDGMALIAPSWSSLQKLISFTNKESSLINMSFNTKKTVCMVFNPTQKLYQTPSQNYAYQAVKLFLLNLLNNLAV